MRDAEDESEQCEGDAQSSRLKRALAAACSVGVGSNQGVVTVVGRGRRSTDQVSEQTPHIDFENLPTPSDGFLVTQFITVRSVARSRAFYSDVLGGQVVLEENPCMVKLANSWVIMNPGGGPTPDKPDIAVVDYEPGNTVSSFLNLRVANIQECYEKWSAKGAEFVTPPIDRGAEIRCYMRDPDGYMIEVGQATGLLEGRLAKKRPEDLPG
jgi:catechol 2,3-dioxygenase-like lactoylglutathione lyase family enzyme